MEYTTAFLSPGSSPSAATSSNSVGRAPSPPPTLKNIAPSDVDVRGDLLVSCHSSSLSKGGFGSRIPFQPFVPIGRETGFERERRAASWIHPWLFFGPVRIPDPRPRTDGNEPGSKGRFQPVSSRNEPGRIPGGRLGSSGARGWTTSRTSNATTVAPRCGWHVHLDPSSLISGRRVRFAGPAASGRRRAPWFERWETPPRTRTAACSWDRRIWPGTPSRRSIS
eukprot:scaffold670_cov333-Pavlova_lutheri.AAC.7